MVSSKGEKNLYAKCKRNLVKGCNEQNNVSCKQNKRFKSILFLLEATDGDKVVLSRNEVFNTDNLYIIMESNGYNIKQSPDRIGILALAGVNKGQYLYQRLKRLTIHKPE